MGSAVVRLPPSRQRCQATKPRHKPHRSATFMPRWSRAENWRPRCACGWLDCQFSPVWVDLPRAFTFSLAPSRQEGADVTSGQVTAAAGTWSTVAPAITSSSRASCTGLTRCASKPASIDRRTAGASP